MKVAYLAIMAVHHVSVPKSFAEGDAAEWFKRFNMGCRANEWEDSLKARKLPTFLKGEALVIWSELSKDEQSDYSKVKKRIVEKMMPI